MTILLFLLINIAFFKPMLAGLVPIPFDALAGVYYPWAGQLWGFAAGVPYKNIAVTDVFSQLYPWRALAMDIIRSGHLPLWNALSFSGYPLLANWQSAPFYPLNILMLIFGNINGFGLMVFLQPLLTMIFLYLFLRKIKVGKIGSIIGSVSFAFAGFSTTYLEYATSGQIFIWLLLALLLIEKYFLEKKKRYLIFYSLCFYPILTGGFFQPALYVSIIIALYTLFRILSDNEIKNKIKSLLLVGFAIIVGCGTAAIQLIPTAELLSLSIRNLDHNIVEYHYGLLPSKNLVTFIAPDFFGNPVTQNFWGHMQYQETAGYFSIIVLILVIALLFTSKKNWREKLFFFLFFFSLIFAFDNPISASVYNFHIPMISTGYASRWLMMTAFSACVLAALGFERIRTKQYAISALFVFILTLSVYVVLKKDIFLFNITPDQKNIALRNLILPLALSFSAVFISSIKKYRHIFALAVVTLLIFDIFRFGSKFTPFSKTEYITRKQPTFEYLKSNSGQSRIAAESSPTLPSNSWIYENLYSPTGYDPLVFKDYGTFFAGLNVSTSSAKTPGTEIVNKPYTRYLNIQNFRSRLIDLVGTKYVIVLKTNKDGRFDKEGKIDSGTFPTSKYTQVFEDGIVVVLENKTVLPRTKLYYQAETANNAEESINKLATDFDFYNKILIDQNNPKNFTPSKEDYSSIETYEPNKVVIKTYAKNGAYLFLSDVQYPGWNVTVNGKTSKVIKTYGVFRGVELPQGESTVVFSYEPQSFRIGLIISLLSLVSLVIFAIIKSKK